MDGSSSLVQTGAVTSLITILPSIKPQYRQAGAEVVDTAAGVWQSTLVTKVRPPSLEEAKMLGGRALISTVQPAQRPDLVEAFQRNRATVFGACVACAWTDGRRSS